MVDGIRYDLTMIPRLKHAVTDMAISCITAKVLTPMVLTSKVLTLMIVSTARIIIGIEGVLMLRLVCIIKGVFLVLNLDVLVVGHGLAPLLGVWIDGF